MTVEELFRLGMKRDVRLVDPPAGTALDLGGGNNPVPGAISLSRPDLDFETDRIPFPDGSVAAVYAFHFFEHLTGAAAVRTLAEVQRVLEPGGVLTMCTPLAGSNLDYQDLDHRSRWTFQTFRTIFANAYYGDHAIVEWQFEIVALFAMSITSDNFALFAQLQKLDL